MSMEFIVVAMKYSETYLCLEISYISTQGERKVGL
jgi:hypothetical protein